MTNSLEDLDHPCKQTCSGWKQGYENGVLFQLTQDQAEIRRLIRALEKLRDGPGNDMVGWKLTWAHEFARKTLELSGVATEA